MIIPGKIITISNAPALQTRIKELEAVIIGLNWQNGFLKAENDKLKDQVNHYRGVLLTEGKERKKLSQERKKYTRTRKGWIPPEQR